MPTATRQRITMGLIHSSRARAVRFMEIIGGKDGDMARSVSLLPSDWYDMGKPEVITVIIEPWLFDPE